MLQHGKEQLQQDVAAVAEDTLMPERPAAAEVEVYVARVHN